jgi:hypothetical protein
MLEQQIIQVEIIHLLDHYLLPLVVDMGIVVSLLVVETPMMVVQEAELEDIVEMIFLRELMVLQLLDRET